MQTNDFVRVSYTAKIKETDQEIDKTEGKSVPVVINTDFLMKGLEEALLGMNVNERKTVEVTPEKAFGLRDPNLVRLIPISEFRKHNTEPKIGMFFQGDNMRGKVLAVSGGRVKVDFNNPLAGKTLIYDIEIKERIDNIDNKVKSLFEIYIGENKEKIKVNVLNDKEVEVEIPPLINSLYKKRIADNIMKILNFEKVKFSEVFEKPKEEIKSQL